jgi:glycosyltransferase involved in cell wall biosynthesis
MSFLSVVIITFNEEKNIRRCLESVQGLADEVVVVDSLSTDGTKKICNELGVRFIEQAFLGYIEQKNFALDQASHDLVLSLDADEAINEVLKAAILGVKEGGPAADGYIMSRCSNYCGKWIRYGTWYPDRKLRLFNRQKARWGGVNPHDKIVLATGARTIRLGGDILHYSYYTFSEHIAQLNKFTSIQARAMHEQGKRTSMLKLLVSPVAAFLSGYIIRRGFLDGVAGLMIARSVSYQTFAKYAKLLEFQRESDASKAP